MDEISGTENGVEANAEGTDLTSDGENGSEDQEGSALDFDPLPPLLIDLVLETLFGFVRGLDLTSCRLVCKKWNHYTIPHMCAVFPVSIPDEGRIVNFVELFRSSESGIAFGAFKLGPVDMTAGNGKAFLQLCGETTLEVDLNGAESEDYVVEVISELLMSTPNIQRLVLPRNLSSRSGSALKLFPNDDPTLHSLKNITFRPDRQRKVFKCCPTFVDELFTATPNLSEISVSHSVHKDGIGIGGVLNCIGSLGLESAIVSLDLDGARVVDIEQLLKMGQKENGLKLKRLVLSTAGIPRDDTGGILMQLAICFKDTLQHLNVKQRIQNNLNGFPYMPNLKSLTFWALPDFDPKPVDLNMNCPVLETFTFCEEKNWEIRSKFFSKFDPCPTVKSFQYSDDDLKMKIFRDILKVFPRLTKFNFNARDDGVEIIGQIWSQMTGLESLSIRGSFGKMEELDALELDSIITGISIQSLKSIRYSVSLLEKMTVDERREAILKLRNEYFRLPSIGNLTRLRSLDLDVDGEVSWRSPIPLTNLTAFMAFYSMHNLRHLHVKRCLFTKTSCDILKNDMGLDTWSFQNHGCENIICPFLIFDRENQFN